MPRAGWGHPLAPPAAGSEDVRDRSGGRDPEGTQLVSYPAGYDPGQEGTATHRRWLILTMGNRAPVAVRGRERADLGPWFTTSQAAAYLRVCSKTVKRWDARGWLTAYRLPSGHRRFAQADLNAAVRDRAAG